jgi:hypothetical protein
MKDDFTESASKVPAAMPKMAPITIAITTVVARVSFLVTQAMTPAERFAIRRTGIVDLMTWIGGAGCHATGPTDVMQVTQPAQERYGRRGARLSSA